MYLIHVSVSPSTAAQTHLAAHREYLLAQFEQGNFLLFGPYEPRNGGGLILAHAASREALDAVLAQDPYFIHQAADYRVQEFSAAKIAANIADYQI
ncbi:YciI family protein [Pasteurella testudinis]|uniref:YciI family protein n=1 Tax=Pasteurella testudinis TaxID=761 RepID=UPI004059F80D